MLRQHIFILELSQTFLNLKTSNQLEVKKVIVLSLLGKVVINEKNVIKGIQLRSVSIGNLIIKIITNQGVVTKRILKKQEIVNILFFQNINFYIFK